MPHADPEAARAYKAAWRKANKAKCDAYREANRERMRTYNREWSRKKYGYAPREEYLAKLAAERDEKENAKKQARAARDARRYAATVLEAEKQRQREQWAAEREAWKLAKESEKAQELRDAIQKAALAGAEAEAERKRLKELAALKRKAESERKAVERCCSRKSGNGTKPSSDSNSTARLQTMVKRPGRIVASWSW